MSNDKKNSARTKIEAALGPFTDSLQGTRITIDVSSASEQMFSTVAKATFDTGKVLGDNPPPAPDLQCVDRQKHIDVFGRSRTDPNGKVRFRLRDIACLNFNSFSEPIFVTATADIGRFACMTIKGELGVAVGLSREPFIEAESWDADGNPLGSVRFNFACRLQGSLNIIE